MPTSDFKKTTPPIIDGNMVFICLTHATIGLRLFGHVTFVLTVVDKPKGLTMDFGKLEQVSEMREKVQALMAWPPYSWWCRF